MKISLIIKEFIFLYPKYFAILFFILVLEGCIAGLSVLSMVPMADYLLDPKLQKVAKVTSGTIQLLKAVGLTPQFWIFGFLFVALNLLKGVMETFIRYSVLKIKYVIVEGLIRESLKNFLGARWLFFSGADQGKLLNTFNKELVTIGDSLGAIATLFAQIVQFGIYIAVPLWLNPTLTITTCVLAGSIGAPFLLLQKLGYKLGKQNTETSNRAMGVIAEVLAAAKLIIGFGKQKGAEDRFAQAFQEHVKVTTKTQALWVLVPSILKPLGMASAIIAMGIAIHKGESISELGAVMWSLMAALPILTSLFNWNISIKSFIPSYEQLIDLKNEAIRLREVSGNRKFNALTTGLEMKNLNFSYPGRQGTLTAIDIKINKGKMTALVGESGSGKSTITDLLLGLQIPSSGEFILDGIPFSEWDQNSFRSKIGYVPQEPFLFHDSIRENLLWSKPIAMEEELWEALRKANAEIFVKQLPDGMDTVVGDRGVRLSGGQRQRIALARALLRNPELLILDEATSSLDTESEKLIQKSIRELSKKTTILAVAHRLSTIAGANNIYVLQKGKIVESGSYKNLLRKKNGVFTRMVRSQNMEGNQ